MLQTIRGLYHIAGWRLRGRPVPPPHAVKRGVIRHYQKKFGVGVLVETGTYLGEMVEAMRPHFREVYSIELSEDLHERAKKLFAADPHVHLVRGDSADAMPDILAAVSEPCLFWLDGHYSGGITARGSLDYPIIRELEHISRHGVRRHVILIDDARLFDGGTGVPSKEQIVQKLREINPDYRIEESDDVIRAYVERP